MGRTNLSNPEPTVRHPADETLAAFADGRLTAHAREEMIEHLASCDDCRSVYDAVADAQDAGVIERLAPVVHGNFGKPLIATLAAAAAATIVFFTPPVQNEVAEWRTGGVSRLVEASASAKDRMSDGRLAGGFPYKPAKRVLRGEKKSETVAIDFDNVEVLSAAANIDREDETPSAKQLRARGVADLVVGQRESAIANLEAALRAARKDDPVILNDLSAAYLAESKWLRDKALAAKALQTAERSLRVRRTPEAMWNRAVALQKLEKDSDAIRAWQEYLAVDSTSEWATEARTQIDDLKNSLLPPL